MSENTELYLVRHGQTDLNRDRRFRGITDAPLNDKGKNQALGAASLMAGSGVEVLHSSPMPRAVQTAEIIAGEIGAEVVVNEGLIDIDYGEWQGLTVEEVEVRFGGESVARWKEDPGGFAFPGGESIIDVRRRLEPTLLGIVRENRGTGAAAVTHMAVLKLAFLVLLGFDYPWFWKVGIENGSVSRFSYAEGAGFILEAWNCLPGNAGA